MASQLGITPGSPSLPTLRRESAIILLAAILVYLRALTNGFVFDDLIHIVQNVDIRTLRGGFASFEHGYFPGNLYRPLVQLSYALTYALWGYNPLPYHVTNIVLHATNGLLVLGILRYIITHQAAFWCALIFVVHPLHVEAVANVSGRAELMAACFGLLGICLMLSMPGRCRGLLRVGALCFLFLASFLCKESALILPLLGALCLYFSRKEGLQLPSRGRALVVSASCATALYLLLRWCALGALLPPLAIDPVDNILVTLPGTERAVNALVLLGRYLVLCLIPFDLAADHSYPAITPLSSQNYIGLSSAASFLLMLGVCVLPLFRSHGSLRGIKFGVLWFLLAFAITANVLFPIGTVFALRLAYVPSIGVLTLFGCALENVRRRVRLGLGIAFALLLALLTFSESQIWRSNESLFEREAQSKNPSVKSLVNLAEVEDSRGQHADAGLLLRRALELYPESAEACFGLALQYLKQGIDNGAAHWLHEALRRNPQHVPALVALSKLQIKLGELSYAEVNLMQALEASPHSFEATSALLALRMQQGRREEGKKLYQELILRDPANERLQRLKEEFHD